MEKIFDFTAPHFPNDKERDHWAIEGEPWDSHSHGQTNLEKYFHFGERLYFGASGNAKDTKLYLDGGLVLEYASTNTDVVSAFACTMKLPDAKHRGDTISVAVEFDVIEEKGNRATQIATGAFATDADMAKGVMPDDLLIVAATCQCRGTEKPTGLAQTFRLNSPSSSGGGAFGFQNFDFLVSDFVRPIPATANVEPWANRSSYPLKLQMKLVDQPGSGDPPKELITVGLTQDSPTVHKQFDPTDGSGNHTFVFGVDDPSAFANTLSRVGYGGVSLNITHPPGVFDVLKGPARVRVRKLTVGYSDKP